MCPESVAFNINPHGDEDGAAAGRQLELKQNKVELVYTLSSLLLLLLLPRTFFNCKLFPKTPFAITQFIFSSSC